MFILGALEVDLDGFIKLPMRATCLEIIIIIVKVSSLGVREMRSVIPEILEDVQPIKISISMSNNLNVVVKGDE
jgi:hypothetical protein